MPEEEPSERVTRLEEQIKSSFFRHRQTEDLIHDTAKEVKGLTSISIRHSETIGVLAKCVYGTIGLVLLVVAGAVLSLVVRPQYLPAAYSQRSLPAAHAAPMPGRNQRSRK